MPYFFPPFILRLPQLNRGGGQQLTQVVLFLCFYQKPAQIKPHAWTVQTSTAPAEFECASNTAWRGDFWFLGRFATFTTSLCTHTCLSPCVSPPVHMHMPSLWLCVSLIFYIHLYVYMYLKWLVWHDGDALSLTVGLFPDSGVFLFIL